MKETFIDSQVDTIDDTQHRILNLSTPRQSAERFIDEYYRFEGIRTLQCVPETKQFWHWLNGYYQPLPELHLREQISAYLASSYYIKKDTQAPTPFPSNMRTEGEILHTLKNRCSTGVSKDPQAGPSWLFEGRDMPLPDHVIQFQNKLLYVEEFLKTGNAMESTRNLTPQFFDVTQLPFILNPFDHGRLLPVKFLDFLDQIFGRNIQSIAFLQQWFGYCLTQMTHHHKMLLLIGPPRSGKGTLARLLMAMLGKGNAVNLTSDALNERFCIENWLNKRLAILADARFSEQSTKAVETLLTISGGDFLTIDRKFQKAVHDIALPTKVMLMSNETPNLKDSGDALASRFIIIKTKTSYLGREDTHLLERDLLPEIPRIIWWALDGLRTLEQNGKFKQPDAFAAAHERMSRNQSPIKAFINDHYTLDPDYFVPISDLYKKYQDYCAGEGFGTLPKLRFFMQLYDLFGDLEPTQKGARGEQFRAVSGLKPIFS